MFISIFRFGFSYKRRFQRLFIYLQIHLQIRVVCFQLSQLYLETLASFANFFLSELGALVLRSRLIKVHCILRQQRHIR